METTKQSVSLTMESNLLARAQAEGLDMSALAEAAIASALARSARNRLEAEIEQACRVHDLYLAEYGSLADAVRAANDAPG